MGVIYYIFHPNQLRAIIQWKLWHDPVHTRDKKKETPTEASCFRFLNLTSRSFSAVIQELNAELLMPVTIFYLVLRALDTIEDDMTIDAKTKEPLLRNFVDFLEQDGWTFNDSGPNEKDRELLVHFDDIIFEFKRLKPEYKDVIRDITIKMGNGMADYALSAELAEGIQSIKDYELYCHYVAGLVGQGLTRLFVQSEHARPQLLERNDLIESMAQFLQKVNIIRDIREDHVDGRRFWPKEIWSKYADNWEDILKPENRTKAVHCQSEMVLNALKHVPECLYYMAGIREQSVFNFVAIPQSMAIATLELIFLNPDMFDRNIKITKGDACKLMTKSTQNLRTLYDVFRDYARRIHQKNDPRDPNYLEISLACGKIEQFIETVFPTQDIKQIHLAQKVKLDEQSMDIGEACVLIMVVCGALLGLGGLMIGTAYFMGPRIESWFAAFDVDRFGKSTEVLTKTIVHGEL